MAAVPKRRVRLLATGLAAVGVATLSVPTVVTVLAEPEIYNQGAFYFITDRGCDGSWAIETNFQDPVPPFSDPNTNLVVVEDVVINGEPYQTAWSDEAPVAFNLPASDFWDGLQPTGTTVYMWEDTHFQVLWDLTGNPGSFGGAWAGRLRHYMLSTRDVAGVPTEKWELITTVQLSAPTEPECGHVHIKKVVTGERADPTTEFRADVNRGLSTGETLDIPFSQQGLGPNHHLLKDSEEEEFSVFRVDEDPLANWEIIGWQVINGDVACPAADASIGTDFDHFNEPDVWYGVGDTQFGPDGKTPIYSVARGAHVTVCFLNEYTAPRGSLRVEKYLDLDGDGSGDDPGEGLLAWSVDVSGPDVTGTFDLDEGPGTKTFANLFSGDSYTVTEAATPGYINTNVSVDGASAGPTGFATAVIPEGATTVVRFFNQPVGSLTIEKWNDINGNGSEDPGLGEGFIEWEVTISGHPSVAGVWTVDGGQRTFGELPTSAVYTITEARVAGWVVIEATVNGISIGSSPMAGATVATNATTVVRFYNQQLGSITVHKLATTVHNSGAAADAPGDDDGWVFTVRSAACAVEHVGVTGEDSTVTFAGLPMCTDYVVTEAPENGSSPGFVPEGTAEYTNQRPDGQTLRFENRRTTSSPPCQDCRQQPPTSTATPAPTATAPAATPTASASPATSTPTAGSTAAPQPSATSPGTQIAGASPPAQGGTPIAPSAGSGVAATGSGAGVQLALMLLAVGCLLAGALALSPAARRRG